MAVSNGSANNSEIPNLSDTIKYRVDIVSINARANRSNTIGPVLAARSELLCQLHIYMQLCPDLFQSV